MLGTKPCTARKRACRGTTRPQGTLNKRGRGGSRLAASDSEGPAVTHQPVTEHAVSACERPQEAGQGGAPAYVTPFTPSNESNRQ